ncbi:DUF4307 domain-containing protein [Streptomyces microflavus]|jgi:hypothetical protein|uniref:Membrane protein n=2 Tax=Streptomyces microflavus TaxID=1919 RepID=A0A7J0CVZ8_STRMI|nr:MULTISPECIES: DUF4307 domain-containing protein [Streptomyces]AGK79663.1 DUF4307 domain containing protein [Streptomyces microflavus DSM 40593]MCX4654819.1 DUF4307 domain-containing protein [Streptomyces microflavus]MDX2407753.1 DUF4307 domain-containing protein [Streptomyces microflavus]MDX2975590.1 DUF4307 domain-containing protein [Streptomyces sp. NRRL_B-2249]WSA62936.1 DUF4307 domain-containing protein [Streptomyces microflavus]
MTAVREATPEGRYGRTDDQRADRKLKIVGSVLGVALLGVVGWIGYGYVTGQGISAELIKFDIVSDVRTEAHLEVRKDREVDGYCTVRALSKDGSEVGRKEARFAPGADRIDELVVMRTRALATAVELTGCTADSSPAR